MCNRYSVTLLSAHPTSNSSTPLTTQYERGTYMSAFPYRIRSWSKVYLFENFHWICILTTYCIILLWDTVLYVWCILTYTGTRSAHTCICLCLISWLSTWTEWNRRPLQSVLSPCWLDCGGIVRWSGHILFYIGRGNPLAQYIYLRVLLGIPLNELFCYCQCQRGVCMNLIANWSSFITFRIAAPPPFLVGSSACNKSKMQQIVQEGVGCFLWGSLMCCGKYCGNRLPWTVWCSYGWDMAPSTKLLILVYWKQLWKDWLNVMVRTEKWIYLDV
jgi:hypothetical protein